MADYYLPKAFGIMNLKGNMCYFSSLVQAMLGCPRLTNSCEELQTIYDKCGDSPLSNGELVVDFLNSFAQNIISEANHGIGSTQACAHECLMFLNKFDKLFKSKYNYIYQCQTCKYISENEVKETHYQINPKHDFNTQLIQCLDKVNYKCERCIGETRLREILLVKPPIIYVILTENVTDIPTELKIDKYDYILMSYIDHYGGYNGGHYIAISRRSNGVFEFNDDKIKKTKLIPNKNTFISFYHIC